MHFTALRLWWLHLRCLPNPCQSDIWWLTTARRNSYQPLLVYRNCAIVEAWLPFMTCRICILRTLLSGWSFCSWYVQIVERLQSLQAQPTWLTWSSDEYPTPFSPEMTMVVIDNDTNIYIEWHNIINESRKKHQNLLLRGNKFWSRSIITTILLPFLTWWLRNPTPVPEA